MFAVSGCRLEESDPWPEADICGSFYLATYGLYYGEYARCCGVVAAYDEAGAYSGDSGVVDCTVSEFVASYEVCCFSGVCWAVKYRFVVGSVYRSGRFVVVE